jgi:hypothetical protein
MHRFIHVSPNGRSGFAARANGSALSVNDSLAPRAFILFSEAKAFPVTAVQKPLKIVLCTVAMCVMHLGELDRALEVSLKGVTMIQTNFKNISLKNFNCASNTHHPIRDRN